MTDTCSTCAYFLGSDLYLAGELPLPGGRDGICRANPPVFTLHTATGAARWPTCNAGDWCGAWEAVPALGRATHREADAPRPAQAASRLVK
jgi:hypothetical protein